jgi:deoxyribodipyrimidine photolyase-related protein
MGNYPRGEWQDTWDGLYWRFISLHKAFFQENPRLALMVKSLDRMDPKRKEAILGAADHFLENLT